MAVLAFHTGCHVCLCGLALLHCVHMCILLNKTLYKGQQMYKSCCFSWSFFTLFCVYVGLWVAGFRYSSMHCLACQYLD